MDDEVTDEEEVIAAVRALEAADGPLRSRDWPALADARLRQLVAHRLRGLGRQLLPVMDEAESAVAGYLSTWSDDAARYLAGVPSDLQEDDLALLTLIYLHWEILGQSPRREPAAGDWSNSTPMRAAPGEMPSRASPGGTA